MKMPILVVLAAVVFCTGCTAAVVLPRATEDADREVQLVSNIQGTEFIVDGKSVVRAKTAKILISNQPHTIVARPDGYMEKEYYVQPPFGDPATFSFYFMIGDKIDKKGDAGRAAVQVDSTPVKTSDVDAVPARQVPRKNGYAVVMGIEQYRQNLPKADYATRDAQTVASYLSKVLGYPEENVIVLTNDKAAKSDMEKYLGKWLTNNVEKDGSVFIYYSGHGAPNPKTGDAFLVPYDGDPTFIDDTGYSLKRLYDTLGKLDTTDVTVVLDSCFSGSGGKSVIAKGARPLVMNIEKSIASTSRKITVLSASSGDQISSSYDDKGHGLFTYFFLKGLHDNVGVDAGGRVRIRELYDYLKPEVSKVARKLYNNEQTPQLIEPR